MIGFIDTSRALTLIPVADDSIPFYDSPTAINAALAIQVSVRALAARHFKSPATHKVSEALRRIDSEAGRLSFPKPCASLAHMPSARVVQKPCASMVKKPVAISRQTAVVSPRILIFFGGILNLGDSDYR
ncbi:hypothetical protein VXM60_18620 [Shewanella khirikhana]|uniref:hypothetical protein n=1 Tax=Shewanella khirikhana TaxID=1965282 RepID=UPI0030D3418E